MSKSLNEIQHIVVVMLENRSFDHMLGYLRLQGHPSEGLSGPHVNFNDFRGERYPIHPLGDTSAVSFDPFHSASDVDKQISRDMGGFVESYWDVIGRQKHLSDADRESHLRRVMGYYTAAELPTYDFFAREYLICDHWFCSVPGATWPNRLYSLTGGSEGQRNNPAANFDRPPGYKLKTVFEILDEERIDWAYFFSDVPFLLLFTNIVRRADATRRIRRIDRFKEGFFDRAKSGTLPALTWIDPNFADYPLGAPANDDHPPADVRNGQILVREIYNALVANRASWSKTLLIITYDEHGGLYDHVVPPAASHDADLARYGVRVPAIVVSPWVPRGGLASEPFDHTSILSTILLRFAPKSMSRMGARVASSNHLWDVLSENTARLDVPDRLPPMDEVPSRTTQVRFSDFGALTRRAMFRVA